MKNAFETKKQPIIRILISGLVILVACLLVCFTLVAALKRSYEKVMENYLNEVHGSVTSVINDIVESTDNIAYSCAVKITDHKYTEKNMSLGEYCCKSHLNNGIFSVNNFLNLPFNIIAFAHV